MAFIGKLYYTPRCRFRTLIVRCLLCGNKQTYTEEVGEPITTFEFGDDPTVVPLCNCYEKADDPYFVPLTMVEDA